MKDKSIRREKLRNEAMRNKEDAYLLLLQLRVQGL